MVKAFLYLLIAVVYGLSLHMAYSTGYTAGQLSMPAQSCPAVKTTQDHLDWWFGGDPKRKHSALKKACKGVRT